jgi:hypothetical protein
MCKRIFLEIYGVSELMPIVPVPIALEAVSGVEIFFQGQELPELWIAGFDLWHGGETVIGHLK